MFQAPQCHQVTQLQGTQFLLFAEWALGSIAHWAYWPFQPPTPPPPQSPEQGHFLVSERSFWEPSDSGVEGASPRQDCREMPCQGLWACECVTVGEGSRVNSHCPVLSAAVARYTGLFGQLPCLSVCLGDVG